MGEITGISWCHHTFNPWIGCTAVSPACAHCYAKLQVERYGGDFGKRRRTVPANWAKPLTWDRKAREAGVRRRVFVASLADVFDNQVPADWRADLWNLIARTPNLDWLLLTKRPQNIARMLPDNWRSTLWPNVWLGTTAENQEEAERRIPHLLAVPAVVRFLSCEPLLGALDLTRLAQPCGWRDALTGRLHTGPAVIRDQLHVDWVICGGESGPNARPMHVEWARSLRDQCAAADVPFHFKQWGEWLPGVQYEPHHRDRDPGDYSRFLCMDWEDGRADVVEPMDDLSGDEVYRVGATHAGCLLDGVLHQAFPA